MSCEIGHRSSVALLSRRGHHAAADAVRRPVVVDGLVAAGDEVGSLLVTRSVTANVISQLSLSDYLLPATGDLSQTRQLSDSGQGNPPPPLPCLPEEMCLTAHITPKYILISCPGAPHSLKSGPATVAYRPHEHRINNSHSGVGMTVRPYVR